MRETLSENGRSLAPPTALNIHRQAINHFKVQHNVRIHKHSNLHEAISSLFHFVVTRCEANFLHRNFLSLRFACLIRIFSFSVKSPLFRALLLCCEHEVFDCCYDITRHLTAIMTTITGVINLTSFTDFSEFSTTISFARRRNSWRLVSLTCCSREKGFEHTLFSIRQSMLVSVFAPQVMQKLAQSVTEITSRKTSSRQLLLSLYYRIYSASLLTPSSLNNT